jgi:HPt (histidine-containing phosphotransfer) domain-containing protein
MKKVVVQVDPDLNELIPGFLANKHDDARKIVAAADLSDYEDLKKIGHRIKGEGGSYGFDGISEIGVRLEHAAIEKNLDDARQCATELSTYLAEVEIVFD